MNKTKNRNAHVGSMSVADHQKFTCDCQSSDHVNNSIKGGNGLILSLWPTIQARPRPTRSTHSRDC